MLIYRTVVKSLKGFNIRSSKEERSRKSLHLREDSSFYPINDMIIKVAYLSSAFLQLLGMVL